MHHVAAAMSFRRSRAKGVHGGESHDADDEEEDGCEELLVRMPVEEDAISIWPPRARQGRLLVAPSTVATIEGAIAAAQQQREHQQQQELTAELLTTGKEGE